MTDFDIDSDEDLFPTRAKSDYVQPSAPVMPVTPPIRSVSLVNSTPVPEYDVALNEEKNELYPNIDTTSTSDSFIRVSISAPRKIGDGIGAFVSYKMTVKTNMISLLKHAEFSVTRRFSDFLGIYQRLAQRYLQMGRIVPPCPEKSFAGMAKVKAGKEMKEEIVSVGDFVDKRRAALERFINRCVASPTLREDPDLIEFLTANCLRKAKHTSALSSANIMKKINFAVDTVSAASKAKINDPDKWFEVKTEQLDVLDKQFRKVHSIINTIIESRKEIIGHMSAFSKTIALLGNCEDHTALGRALSQLAEIEESIVSVHSDASLNDFYILSELFKDYIGLIGAIKDVIQWRSKIFLHWQTANTVLARKKEHEYKAKTSRSEMKDEIRVWEDRAEQGRIEFQNISSVVKLEVTNFDIQRLQEFKLKLVAYLQKLMASQMKILKLWEEFVPKVKNIITQ